MESQLQDIRDGTTLGMINQLKESVIDCAKNIKSNDITFHISTLPTVRENLTRLMDSYLETVHSVESCQNAFTKLHEQLEQLDDDQVEEFVDLNTYSEKFKHTIEEERAVLNSRFDGRTAQTELNEIIGPHIDEEIQVEAPECQIPKDPITKRDIQVAVKSTVCHHIYDQDGIEEYFRQKEQAKKTRIQCPQAGCTNKNMKRTELILDEETNRLIQAASNK
mgnify:CR=1 FL=1